MIILRNIGIFICFFYLNDLFLWFCLFFSYNIYSILLKSLFKMVSCYFLSCRHPCSSHIFLTLFVHHPLICTLKCICFTFDTICLYNGSFIATISNYIYRLSYSICLDHNIACFFKVIFSFTAVQLFFK